MIGNQEIERIYMSKLKDIETAVWILEEKKNIYQNNIISLRKRFQEPRCPIKPRNVVNIHTIMDFLKLFFELLFLFVMVFFACALIIELKISYLIQQKINN